MKLVNILFGITDWLTIEPTTHAGKAGMAYPRSEIFDVSGGHRRG